MESLKANPSQTLSDQLRALQESRSTCNIRVHDGWREGALRVEHGEVVSSTFGELSGPPALDAMLAAGDSVLFALLPEPGQPALSADESMVVPISTWTEAPVEPVTAPVLEELPAGARSPEQHAAIVLDEADAQPAAATRPSSTPPALRLDTPAAKATPSPEPEPEQGASAPPTLRLDTSSPAPESRPTASEAPASHGSKPGARVLIGALVAFALLFAIGLARTLEQESRSAPQAAATQPAAMSGNTTPTAVAAATRAADPQPSASKPPAPAAPLQPAAAPTAPAGALAPTIAVRVLIGADGRVKQAELAGRRDGFAAAEQRALEIAGDYRFPPQSSGDTWLTVPVRFRPTPPTRHVLIKGSDTLGVALIPAWAEALRRTQPELQMEVESLGTTPGLAALLDGSADIAAASRLIRADELALTEKLGLQLREVFVGYDAVALIVHPDNPLRTLDLDTVARIYAQEISNWRELGGPDLPLHVIGRPSYSGTHRFVKERVLSRLGPDTSFGSGVTSVEQGRDVVAAVAKDPAAIGYVSLALSDASVRALPITAGKAADAVQPSAASVRDGSYPLARALALYLRPDSGADAHALVDFALSAEGQRVLEQNGFVPLPPGLAGRLEEVADSSVGPSELIRIYFEPSSVAIASDSLSDLNAAGLATRARRAVIVVGNADSSGDAEANRRLAQRRAEVVAAKLRQLGSREATITVQVAAAEKPIASNQTSEGRRANRRVDVIIRSAAR